MDLEDYAGSEIAVAVAATAAILSPRVRGAVRKGLVFGLAGALMAGDAVASFARGVSRGAQQVGVPGTTGAKSSGNGATATEGD